MKSEMLGCNFKKTSELYRVRYMSNMSKVSMDSSKGLLKRAM
jgi:hypothetical protein